MNIASAYAEISTKKTVHAGSDAAEMRKTRRNIQIKRALLFYFAYATILSMIVVLARKYPAYVFPAALFILFVIAVRFILTPPVAKQRRHSVEQ